MERKLATIQKISDLQQIPDADRIEVATILGWRLVVLKGEFHIGDLCVYCEIDSILPQRPEFEFLRKSCWSPTWNGFRIRTIKLKKQLSQGIAFPLSILPTGKWKEGVDVTETLGIIKYDPQAREEELLQQRRKHNAFHKFLMSFRFIRYIYKKLGGKRTSSWPGFISKTDEERVQNLGWLMPELVGKVLYITEKLDGQSATYAYYKKKFYVCSRNLWLPIKNNSNYWKIAEKYDMKNKLQTHYKMVKQSIAIQGEIVGPGVQGNKYNLQELKFYAFNYYNIERQSYSPPECSVEGFPCVPKLRILEFDEPPTTEQFVELSKGKSVIGDTLREGIVVRTFDKSISFKAVNPDFLEQHKDA